MHRPVRLVITGHLLASALLLATGVHAEGKKPVAIGVDSVSMTAAQFFAAYMSPEAVQRERAEMYLLGLMDAGEGRLWCDYKTYKTVTLRERVFTHLKSLPDTQMKERAADVIARLLAERYPCKGGK